MSTHAAWSGTIGRWHLVRRQDEHGIERIEGKKQAGDAWKTLAPEDLASAVQDELKTRAKTKAELKAWCQGSRGGLERVLFCGTNMDVRDGRLMEGDRELTAQEIHTIVLKYLRPVEEGTKFGARLRDGKRLVVRSQGNEIERQMDHDVWRVQRASWNGPPASDFVSLDDYVQFRGFLARVRDLAVEPSIVDRVPGTNLGIEKNTCRGAQWEEGNWFGFAHLDRDLPPDQRARFVSAQRKCKAKQKKIGHPCIQQHFRHNGEIYALAVLAGDARRWYRNTARDAREPDCWESVLTTPEGLEDVRAKPVTCYEAASPNAHLCHNAPVLLLDTGGRSAPIPIELGAPRYLDEFPAQEQKTLDRLIRSSAPAHATLIDELRAHPDPEVKAWLPFVERVEHALRTERTSLQLAMEAARALLPSATLSAETLARIYTDVYPDASEADLARALSPEAPAPPLPLPPAPAPAPAPTRETKTAEIQTAGTRRAQPKTREQYCKDAAMFLSADQAEVLRSARDYYTDKIIDAWMCTLPDVNALPIGELEHYPGKGAKEREFVRHQYMHLTNHPVVLVPVNVSQHYILYAAFRTERVVQRWDADAATRRTTPEYVEVFFRDLWGTSAIETVEMNVPQQTTNFDCGVYLCAFAEYISNHMTTFLANPRNPNLDPPLKINAIKFREHVRQRFFDTYGRELTRRPPARTRERLVADAEGIIDLT